MGKLCSYAAVTSAPSGALAATLGGSVNQVQRLTASPGVQASLEGIFGNTSGLLASDASQLTWHGVKTR